MATDMFIPKSLHAFLQTFIAYPFKMESFSSVISLGLSICPVRLTPKSLSSSHFCFQEGRRKGNSVRQDCIAPSQTEALTFSNKSSNVSPDRTTTSVRLQNSPVDTSKW